MARRPSPVDIGGIDKRRTGTAGTQGARGPSGERGSDGRNGAPGAKGDPGEPYWSATEPDPAEHPVWGDTTTDTIKYWYAGTGPWVSGGALGDSGWQAPTLVNAWVAYGGAALNPGYRKVGTTVRLRGAIKSGTAADNTTLFTLPAGYRPAGTVMFRAPNPTSFAVVQILSTGEVQVSGGATNAFLHLDGMTFTTD